MGAPKSRYLEASESSGASSATAARHADLASKGSCENAAKATLRSVPPERNGRFVFINDSSYPHAAMWSRSESGFGVVAAIVGSFCGDGCYLTFGNTYTVSKPPITG